MNPSSEGRSIFDWQSRLTHDFERLAIAPKTKAGFRTLLGAGARHPLTSILLSAAIGSLVIPKLVTITNQSNVINEARLQRCQDILKNSEQSDRELNSLMTGLQIVQKDAIWLGTSFRSERRELRSWMREAYLAFDRDAWWWVSRLDTEAKLLRIGVDYDRLLGPLIAAYRNNLAESTRVIDKMWTHVLREDHKSMDPSLAGCGKA